MKPPADAQAQAESSIEIAASPEAVYDLVSDLPRMGEWSPESTGGQWKDGGTGQVGDWFEGVNATPEREWVRESEVASAERGSDFTFVVGGVASNCTWWSYEMAPNSDGGTTLTERWWVANFTPAMEAATPEQRQARFDMTLPMLEATLAAVKKTAEA